MAWEIARRLDDRGRCCGRKPIVYRRPAHLYCDRCDRSFNLDGAQIGNWAWGKNGEGFDRVGPPYPKDDKPEEIGITTLDPMENN